MILVTGATGQYGTKAINHLLRRGVDPSAISALVRDEEKAKGLKEVGIELRKGDYSDYGSLLSAFQGVEKLLFVSGSDIENREAQHANVVKAATEAGVKHIAYTSFARRNDIDNSAIDFIQDTHIKTENWIRESGIQYTFLQNAIYMDMIPMFIGENIADTRTIFLPAQDGKSSGVLRDELAEAAAIVLTSEGHLNQSYPLTHTHSFSYADIAKELTQVLGKEIKYHSPSINEFTQTMQNAGVPGEYIGLFTAFSVAQAQGELEKEDGTLERLLGRKPTQLSQFVANTYR